MVCRGWMLMEKTFYLSFYIIYLLATLNHILKEMGYEGINSHFFSDLQNES